MSEVPRRRQILQALRVSPGLSKVELARRLTMSPATAGIVVEELQHAGLVVSRGLNHATGGRPSERLALNDRRPLVLAVRLSRTGVHMGVLNLAGALVIRHSEPLRWSGSSVSVEAVIEAAGRFLRGIEYPVSWIGLGAPGLVDTGSGTIRYAANFGWRDVPLRRMLSATTDIPVAVDQNKTVALIAEDWWGAAGSADPAVYAMLGAEIGVAIRIGDAIVRGATDGAGEFGHIPIAPDGPRCGCGKRGCLESLASTVALRRRYRALRGQKATRRPLAAQSPGISELAAAAEAGEPEAVQALTEVSEHLGTGLAMLVNVLNPRLIVLGDELMEAADFLVPRIRRVVQQRALSQLAAPVAIRPSTLGNDAPLLGAGTLALDALFKDLD